MNGLSKTGEGGDRRGRSGPARQRNRAVALGGTNLTPGASASVQLSEDLAFEIQVQNQGENTENDVTVR